MKTAEEIRNEFIDELKALLEKYDAEIDLIEDGGYGDERGLDRMEVYIKTKWDKDYNIISEGVDINLGRFMCAD